MAASSELLQKLQRRRERMGEDARLRNVDCANEGIRPNDFEAVKVQQRRLVFEAANSDRADLGKPLRASALTAEELTLPQHGVEKSIPESYQEDSASDTYADNRVSDLHQNLQRRRRRTGERLEPQGSETSLFDSDAKDLEMVNVDERRTRFESGDMRITIPNAHPVSPGRLDLSKGEQLEPQGNEASLFDSVDKDVEVVKVDERRTRFESADIHMIVPSAHPDTLGRSDLRKGEQLDPQGSQAILFDSGDKDLEMVKVEERRTWFEGSDIRITPPITHPVTPGRLDLSMWEHQLDDGQATQKACPEKHLSANTYHEMLTRSETPQDGMHAWFTSADKSPQIPISAIDSPTSFSDSSEFSDVANDLLQNLDCGEVYYIGDDNCLPTDTAIDFETVSVDERRSMLEHACHQEPQRNVQPGVGRLNFSKLGDQEYDNCLPTDTAIDFETISVDERRSMLEPACHQEPQRNVQPGVGTHNFSKLEDQGYDKCLPTDTSIDFETVSVDVDERRSMLEHACHQEPQRNVQPGVGRLNSSKLGDQEYDNCLPTDTAIDIETISVDERRAMFERAGQQEPQRNVQPGVGRLNFSKLGDQEFDNCLPTDTASDFETVSVDERRSMLEHACHQEPQRNVQPGVGTHNFSKLGDQGSDNCLPTDTAIDFETISVDERRAMFERAGQQEPQSNVHPGVGRLILSKLESQPSNDKPALESGPCRQHSECISKESSSRDDGVKIDQQGFLAEGNPAPHNSIHLVHDAAKGLDPCDGDLVQDPHPKRDHIFEDDLTNDATSVSHDSQSNDIESADITKSRFVFAGIDLLGAPSTASSCILDLSPWEEELLARGVLTYQQACLLSKHAPRS